MIPGLTTGVAFKPTDNVTYSFRLVASDGKLAITAKGRPASKRLHDLANYVQGREGKVVEKQPDIDGMVEGRQATAKEQVLSRYAPFLRAAADQIGEARPIDSDANVEADEVTADAND